MMLKADKVTKAYGGKRILQDASFHIGKGEFVSMMGTSGEGKSTFARIICGTVRRDTGSISFEGTPLWHTGTYHPASNYAIQLIPQQPFASLDPRQTITAALMEPLLFHKISRSRSEAQARAHELLSQMHLGPELFSRRPGELSGGQAQRALIARSLTLTPKLLIADEATSMLDVSSQTDIINIFRTLVEKEHISVLLISHDQPLVESVSQRIYQLSHGKLMEI